MKIINKGVSMMEIDKVFVMGMLYQRRDPRSCSCSC